MLELMGKPSPAPWKFKNSLRVKLFLSFALLLGFVFAVILASIMMLDMNRSKRELAKVEATIRNSIFLKGSRISRNYAIALRSLAEENSITAIREIVNNTVDGDPDFAYGIFMDAERRPWALRIRNDTSQDFDSRAPLQDSMSLWAAGRRTVEHHSFSKSGTEFIEFASPILTGDEIHGIVRFGFGTQASEAAIREAASASRAAHGKMLFVLSTIALTTFLLAMLASTYQAGRIIRPISALTVSASRMAGGDYGSVVKVMGTDEISVLARAFEAMRLEIRNYMENLYSLVEEKVQQIRDILDNIDQGLFSFDLDLNVNADFSRKAQALLQVDGIAGLPLAQVLKIGPREEALFRDWVEIVRAGHEGQRWQKLSRLAPVREIQRGTGDSARYLQLEYQKVLDKRDHLVKIMVLVHDVTDSRLIHQRMAEEKRIHENRVHTVLGVASHPQETILEFIRDSENRLQSMQQHLDTAARDGQTPADFAAWDMKSCAECHTIKGNSGAFGFETLMQLSQEFETLLQDPDSIGDRSPARLKEMERLTSLMLEETGNIKEIHTLLAGNAEEMSVKLPERKISRIRDIAEMIETETLTPELSDLVANCRRISYRSLTSMSRKYQELVDRAAGKLGKKLAFTVSSGDVEIDPAVIFRIDEALIHLLRNAVAHGIEDEETRLRLKKGPGRVELSYAQSPGRHIFTLRDDGKGIDAEAVIVKAVKEGVVTTEAASQMGEREKLDLIFHPGLTTSEVTDTISGRGLGMPIAMEVVLALSGTLSVETWRGIGTRFTIDIPL